jgi:hypothetical protein
MEEALRAWALKSAHGRQNHRTPSGLCVCCERALKSAGELLSTCGLAGAGTFGKPPARGTVGVTGLAISGDLAAGVSPAGKLLTARWASGFAARSSLRSRRPSGPQPQYQYNILHYITLPLAFLLLLRVAGGA